jgi:DNA polymerase-3 subunit gamma/tau
MTDPSAASRTADVSSAGRYVVIARRYRPQSFEELIGQEHVARALQQAIASDRVGHAYLFTGARGVGKTSAARILAKALNCERGPTPTPCNQCDVCLRVAAGDDVDVLEIDGASNRGIDEIRQLRQNVAVRPSRVRFKVYIIDEVHMLTKEAFNALLKTLEEPPEHVKFIFATTEPHKIPITILSRCQRYDFAGISMEAIQARLEQIAAAEGVRIEREALQILASRAAGSMRDSQSLLEQLLAVGRESITAADVTDLLGVAPAERLSGLIRRLVGRDASGALAELDGILQAGVDVGLLLDQLVGYFRDMMAAAVGCPDSQFLYAMPSQAGEIRQMGQQLGLAKILAIGQILDHTSARMRSSMHGRTLVEMAVVRICQLDELEDLAALVEELRAAGQGAEGTAGARPGSEGKKNAEGRAAVPNAAAAAGEAAQRGASLVERFRMSTTAEDPRGPASEAPAEQRSATINDEQPAAHPRPKAEPRASANDSTARRSDRAHGEGEMEANRAAESSVPSSKPVGVLSEWQRMMAENRNPPAASAPPRPTRREQLAQITEQPFVRRAMELFDVPPDKVRYTPPAAGTSEAKDSS